MTWTSCTICGTPSPASRCAAHARARTASRGYDARWAVLSRRARRLQPWCSRCRATNDLTCDHLVWPALTLHDVQVLCRSCNSSKGAAR